MRASALVPRCGALALAATLGWTSDARAQCSSDAECEAGQTCRARVCVVAGSPEGPSPPASGSVYPTIERGRRGAEPERGSFSRGDKVALAGGLTFLVSWVATIIGVAGSSREEAGASVVPVAGAIVVFAGYERADSSGSSFGGLSNLGGIGMQALMVVSSVAQSAGLITLLVGVGLREPRSSFQSLGPRRPERPGKSPFTLEPWAPPGSVGSGLRLRF